MHNPDHAGAADQPRATQWLSRGFEQLLARLHGDQQRGAQHADFDVVIVGSGYGGAVAAAELAAQRGDHRSVCVLERGREYLAGQFPARMAELASHVRFSSAGSSAARGYREGLFDLRLGTDVNVLLANGVGGGSLINAGVMLAPRPEVLRESVWPEPIRSGGGAAEIEACARTLQRRLGASQTVADVGQPLPAKFQALSQLAPKHACAVPITVALGDGITTAAGVPMNACVRCGDCATGCNHGAKISLDVTLLAEAAQAGAEIFAGATLLRIEREAAGDAPSTPPLWRLHVVHTDTNLRRRQGEPFVLRARRVVLAAGTLGSSEILLRSRTPELRFSGRLGHRFSANGDVIALGYDTRVTAACVGDETVAATALPLAQRVGPTITGLVDLRETQGLAIEELAVPGPLAQLFEQLATTGASLHQLGEADDSAHRADYPDSADAAVVDPARMRRTLVLALMARDSADGLLRLNCGGDAPDAGDGALTVVWPRLRDDPRLAEQHRRLQALFDASPIQGRMLPNPLWRPLPERFGEFLQGANGPLLTVHPLGGCAMGDSGIEGVVDHCGRVFDAAGETPEALHDGLVVLDGSVLPTSLGINPALTIASVALRAVERLRADWGFTAPRRARTPLGARPVFRAPPQPVPPKPTEVELIERLSGRAVLGGVPRHLELTLRFEPIALRALMRPGARLELAPGRGKLRVFAAEPRADLEAADADALLVATLSGSLRVLGREASSVGQRRWHALGAWWLNRGLRDSLLWGLDRLRGQRAGSVTQTDEGIWDAIKQRALDAWRLASRAGAVRRLDYQLSVERLLAQPADDTRLAALFQPGTQFSGAKRLTYARRGNPWRQLMEMTLAPGLAGPHSPSPVLTLDTGYLARQGVPLLRIVGQQDQPGALADLAAFGLYLLRVLLHGHLWSFRAPDAPPPRRIDRLPGNVRGLPAPEVVELPVATLEGSALPVLVRLTRYRAHPEQRRRALARNWAARGWSARAALRTPVLLIHGYSVSGTTFAHPAVRPNLAGALHDAGRDVWIVDLRTSAGMPHARHGWSFEDAALNDIPVAVAHVLAETDRPQLDIVAHCMGSAMLGMALLAERQPDEAFWPLRENLHHRIRRLALSQIAPAMVFTPTNVFRAYALRYLQHFLPLKGYRFRPSDDPSLGEQLLDRLLATLPYPEAEFDRENPLWTPWRRTPWVGTRHRMDALYGRDFSVNNMARGVLETLDDQFGPLSIDTVTQVMHFARFKSITDRRGFNAFMRPERLRERYASPLLSVHGGDNGLASPATLAHWRGVLRDAGLPEPESHEFAGFGHQDCMIGRGAGRVFQTIVSFFDGARPLPDQRQAPKIPQTISVYSCQPPALGVRLDGDALSDRIALSALDDGGRGAPLAGVFVPLAWQAAERRWLLFDGSAPVEPDRDAFARLLRLAPPVPVDPLEPHGRLRFAFSRTGLVLGPDGLLLLLLYPQSFALGSAIAGVDDGDELPPEQPAAAPTHPAPWFHALAATAPGDAAAAELKALSPADPDSALIASAAHHAFHEYPLPALRLGVVQPAQHDAVGPAPVVRSFALASCQYPGGLLDRTPAAAPDRARPGPSDRSLLRLAARLDAGDADVAPRFLILAGDQVYVDATAGLFDPKTLDDRFSLPYQNFFGSRGARAVLGRLPAYMLLDDHEIDDNWEPDPDGAWPRPGASNEALRDAGVRAFLRQQRDRPVPPQHAQPRLWSSRTIDGFAFFLADARTERKPRRAHDMQHAALFGPEQMQAITHWLAEPGGDGPRFLVTAPMLLPRLLTIASQHGGAAASLRSDAWDGYPATLHRMLAQVFERGGDDVVFLSGDAHLGNVTRIALTRHGSERTVVAHSVHCPALYAPFPFANAVADDFAVSETFAFGHGGARYRCAVKSWFPQPGDGFALLTVGARANNDNHGDHRWRVSVTFDRADGRSVKSFMVPRTRVRRADAACL